MSRLALALGAIGRFMHSDESELSEQEELDDDDACSLSEESEEDEGSEEDGDEATIAGLVVISSLRITREGC